MSAVILDVAMSIDGFWADEAGASLYPVDDMHDAGLIAPLVSRTGAVVMSLASFNMAGDPDWYAGNYEYQVPVFVIGPEPRRRPAENGLISFDFAPDFPAALAAAKSACGDRDVMIIGEASAAQSALASGAVDEIYLRIVPCLMGKGIPLFDGSALSRLFRPASVTTTERATHLHLVTP